ncbi:MAG: DDE-type integrase/transposase/recombinase [Candidatus Margulisbacteria bacterium]|nr:DDE-type integrase/transposase/recombinase [Candidatus Margulisiibacteriota bacterium]
MRKKRKKKCGESWYIDETYIKIKGRNRYIYRAIDRDGNLVDCMVSAKRNMNAARRGSFSHRSYARQSYN